MVLAHSLRDNGTRGKLAVLVTPDTLQPVVIDELKVGRLLEQEKYKQVRIADKQNHV